MIIPARGCCWGLLAGAGGWAAAFIVLVGVGFLENLFLKEFLGRKARRCFPGATGGGLLTAVEIVALAAGLGGRGFAFGSEVESVPAIRQECPAPIIP
jgi:hypothetical protein